MAEPIVKRFRLQELARQISDQAGQHTVRAAFESGTRRDPEYELKRKIRKTTILKPTSIRPLPLRNENLEESYSFYITKQPLGNVIFGRSNKLIKNTDLTFECPTYEFRSRRKLVFFPLITGGKLDRLYACVDCFHMTVLRNRLENVPVCKWEELGDGRDPLRFPHYCAHWDALTSGQKIYFKEFFWQYNTGGMFVKKMCSYDAKTARFCQESEEGQDNKSLISYIQNLDYTCEFLEVLNDSSKISVKDQVHAESFLDCFKMLHKSEITTDDQGRIRIESSSDLQDNPPVDSQSLNSLQKVSKRPVYAPPAATLSSIQSMQNASSLVSGQLKTPANSISTDSHPSSSQDDSKSAASNNLAGTTALQELVTGLSNTTAESQPLNAFPDLDVKQFITGLLMSTMTTLQVLYDGLRPLVARYAPDCLSQFIAMIQKIDRNMPVELQSVKLNTAQSQVKPSELGPSRIVTTTTVASHPKGGLPKIFRRIITPGGTSTNPITIVDSEEPKKALKQEKL